MNDIYDISTTSTGVIPDFSRSSNDPITRCRHRSPRFQDFDWDALRHCGATGMMGMIFCVDIGNWPKKKNVVYQQFPQGTLQDSASLRLLSQIPIEVSQPEST